MPPLGAGLEQVVVDLARAEQHPLHRRRRRAAPVSPSTGWNVPVVKSATGETHELVPQQRLRREHDQRLASSATGPGGAAGGSSSPGWSGWPPACCPRRTAAGTAPSRPEVWSGPWPSWPCGSSSVTRGRWPHFTSPEEMNSSTIDWAPLTKSPNCASQQHQRVRVLHRVAVLEAHRGVLAQQRVVHEEPAAVGSPACVSGR